MKTIATIAVIVILWIIHIAVCAVFIKCGWNEGLSVIFPETVPEISYTAALGLALLGHGLFNTFRTKTE